MKKVAGPMSVLKIVVAALVLVLASGTPARRRTPKNAHYDISYRLNTNNRSIQVTHR